MTIISQHQRLFATLSLLVIIGAVIGDTYFLTTPHFGPVVPAYDPANPPSAEGLAEAQASNQINPLLALAIAGGAIIGVVGIAAISLYEINNQKKSRDSRRIADLNKLAQAFEKYKQQTGHYPISSAYQPQNYTGLNLATDWSYYNLPSADQMKPFLPEWPVVDPSVSLTEKDQTNQYLYYPRDNGARFDLYAHLEASEDLTDYNRADDLPQAWGSYNFKLSNLTSPTQPPNPTSQPTPLSQETANSTSSADNR